MAQGAIITSTAIPLHIENVDTDQIIPARYLKKTSMQGFGEGLFRDWRFDAEGNSRESFVLNDPVYRGKILLAGKNFGCGSSREHAVWAIQQYGFQAVITSTFADIFKQNALNNGLLAIEVGQDFLETLIYLVMQDPGTILRIDIEKQQVEVPAYDMTIPFNLDPFKKACILQGMDDLEFLLSLEQQIRSFEKNQVIY